MDGLFIYIFEHSGEILTALWQHVCLSGLAVLLGFCISLAICITNSASGRQIDHLINLFSFLRLIPGIALLVVTMPIIGTGFFPALLSLIVITIPSILVNTYSGIKNISPSLIESAVGLGLNERQILYRIKLPAASPFILLGVRTAVVDSITIATVASLMGAGGLGRYILTGLSINDFRLIVIGSILVTSMAFLSEIILGWMQKRLQYKYTGVQE